MGYSLHYTDLQQFAWNTLAIGFSYFDLKGKLTLKRLVNFRRKTSPNHRIIIFDVNVTIPTGGYTSQFVLQKYIILLKCNLVFFFLSDVYSLDKWKNLEVVNTAVGSYSYRQKTKNKKKKQKKNKKQNKKTKQKKKKNKKKNKQKKTTANPAPHPTK